MELKNIKDFSILIDSDSKGRISVTLYDKRKSKGRFISREVFVEECENAQIKEFQKILNDWGFVMRANIDAICKSEEAEHKHDPRDYKNDKKIKDE